MMPERPSFLGLYRTGLSTPEHRRYVTVARQPLVRDTLEHLRGSMSRKSKHHFLFIGPRGIGKTHLLSLIEDEVTATPELAAHYIIARFPEESHRTLSFADFLLGLCDILRHRLPDEKPWQELHEQLAAQEDDSIIVDTLVPVLRRQNREKKRTLLVMLENLSELFTKQIRNKTDVASLRKFFMDDNGCLLMATAPMHFDAITSVSEPFYDFFDVQVLDLLDKAAAIELIRRNLEWDHRHDLLKEFDTLRPKLMALHDMTNGSPRLILMLYELIAHDSGVQVRPQFLQLLDRVTPYYQDRMRDIAAQERAVLETMATMRDEPKTPASIAARMRLSQPQTSTLLKRLTDARYLKTAPHPNDKRSRLYSIRDGFFDIWLAMNLSRHGRQRLPLLVECLARFYPEWEKREKKRRELRGKSDRINATESLNLLSEIAPPYERAQAKMDLSQRPAHPGHSEQPTADTPEARRLPLDSEGRWIRQPAESESATNYLDEIQEMIERWTVHRSGNLEAFMERLSKLENPITLKTYSETKLAFLREQLALVTEARERIRLRSIVGNLLHDLARWTEAEAEIKQAMQDAESIGDYKLLSTNLNNLATLFQASHRLAEAEPLLQRALALDEQSYGANHPNVARDINNLAQLLRATNRMVGAERLLRRALEILGEFKRNTGQEHPNYRTVLSNLQELIGHEDVKPNKPY